MFTFPGMILPAFAVVALLLAVLLRRRSPESPWRYRDILVGFCVVLAVCCALLVARGTPPPREEAATRSEPGIEVDMLVSRGNMVELWVNDWQHPSERLPVIAGERHVYQFKQVPREITLIRLDPTEQPDARIVIYSLAVKAGDRVVRQFGPAELKNWTLVNLSPPKEENGGLALLDSNDDPILWSPVIVHLPESKAQAPLWLQWLGAYWPFVLLTVALLILLLGRAQLSRPCPDWGGWAGWKFAPLLAALLAAGGTVYVQNQNAGSEAGVEVDMLVSRGHVVEMWANDWVHTPERLEVIEGQRHVYRFENLPRHITQLRLDPTDLADAKVVIYSLAVKSADRTFQRFGPEELKHWTLNNLSPPRDEDGGLALDDINDDPILWTPLALQLPGSMLQAIAAALIGTPDAPFLLAITAFLLVLLARMSTRTGRMQAVLIAVSSGVAYPVVLLAMKLNLSSPPVTADVGYASYHGYAKADEYLAALAVMLICILLGYVLARFAGHGGDEVEDSPLIALRNGGRRRNWMVHAAVLGLLLVYFLPNVRGLMVSLPAVSRSEAHGTNLEFVQSLSQTKYRHVQWDAANELTWTYMLNAGLRPLRDFWFPYSGWYLQLLPFPTGPLMIVAHCTVLLWVLYWSLFRIAGRRLGQALAIFGLILTPVLMGLLPEWDRYLVAVDVALLYVAVCEANIGEIARLDWKIHAPVAAFVAYAFFFEPTQVVCAGAGMAAHIILSALSGFQGGTLRERVAESARVLKQRLVSPGIPLLAGIAGGLLIFAGNGMLPGLWDFEKSIGDQGDYAAVPSEIAAWVQPVLQPDTVFLLMFLLASYAVYRWVRLKGQPDPLGSALVVLCGTAFMAMQKQILRPHVMTQVRLFPYVAVVIFGLIGWRERQAASRIVMAVFVGCILGIAVNQGALHEILRQDIEEGPGKVSGVVHALLDQKEFAQANASLYSRARFSGFDEENAVVDTLSQSCGLRGEDSVYVLGDNSLFYILLNQPPPYLSNSYNDSPRYEQQKVLDWFHRKKPRFIIWDPKDSIFDSVPHLVRLPLLYTYVVEHYQFVREAGPYQILTERPRDLAPDLEYWRRMLGDRVDLGSIPGRARLAEYADCGGDVARCDAVLVVRYPQARAMPRGKVTVDVDSPGGPFRMQFDVAPEEREYVVNLNRLWFWNMVSKPAPRITAEDAASEAAMDYRSERSPVLY
jgi:hypothetical protein